MGPPRTHDPMPPEFAEDFEDWLYTRAGDAGLGELLGCHEAGTWRHPRIICPAVYSKLSAAQRDMIRAKAIHLMLARESATFRVGKTAWRTDGKRLWAAMA